MSLAVTPRERWTDADALAAAALALSPEANGGLVIGTATPEALAPHLKASADPAWLVQDGPRALLVTGSPNPTQPEQRFLHFSNAGFGVFRVAQVLRAFIARHPAQWCALVTRPELNVMFRHLDFHPVARTEDVHLFMRSESRPA